METTRVGLEVRIVRGRKHFGEVGRIFCKGVGQLRTYYRNDQRSRRRLPNKPGNQRLGIETFDGQQFFVPGNHVEVLSW